MKYDSDLIEATYLIQKSNPELAQRIWDRLIPKVEAPQSRNDLHVGYNVVISETVVNYIKRNCSAYNKVGAIKFMREQTGLGLKDAKDAVELMMSRGMLT